MPRSWSLRRTTHDRVGGRRGRHGRRRACGRARRRAGRRRRRSRSTRTASPSGTARSRGRRPRLEVPRGSIFGLIGPNGAGKIDDLLDDRLAAAPDARLARRARSRPGHEPPARCAGGSATCPTCSASTTTCRVDEYLEFFAAAYRVPRKEWPGLDRRPARAGRPRRQAHGDGQLAVAGHEAAPQPGPRARARPRAARARRAGQRPRPPGPRRAARPRSPSCSDMGKTIVDQLAHPRRARGDVHRGRDHGGRPAARRRARPRQIIDTLGGARTVAGALRRRRPARRSPVADDAEQAALLRRLVVDEERGVVEFREERRRPRGALHVRSPKGSSNERLAVRRLNPVLGRELTRAHRGLPGVS